jgi:hypothetical protein
MLESLKILNSVFKFITVHETIAQLQNDMAQSKSDISEIGKRVIRLEAFAEIMISSQNFLKLNSTHEHPPHRHR